MLMKYNHKTMEDSVVDLWNDTLIYDAITKEKFRKNIIFDENFDNDLCCVYLIDNAVVGFILGMKRKFPYLERGLEEDKAWISIVFVKETYQRQGIGTLLLKEIEKRLNDKSTKTIFLANYSPSYFLAGLDKEHYPISISFFEKNSYIEDDNRYSMGRKIHGFKMSNHVLKLKNQFEENGYKFINFDYKYAVDVLEFLKNEFGGGWKRNALLAMQNNTAEDVICIVLNKNDEVCGVSNRAIDGNNNRFGPIGISKKERNNGLGSVLLEFSMYEMFRRNIYYMYFMTTDELGKKYYERLGLKLIRTYTTYKKEL